MADHQQSEVRMFVATLLHSSTVTHLQHWTTTSYAKHVALGEYYDEIIELVDRLAEAYMGRYERFENFKEDFAHYEADPVKYLTSIKEFVQEARKHLPQDTELQNLIDEIAQLIDSTLYKLKNLE